jgi:N-acetylmuramoyl-L-alanine amidase
LYAKLQYFNVHDIVLLVPMVKKLQYYFLLISVVVAFSGMSVQLKGGAITIKTIVIDAGHGGKDPGCQGTLHKEKDVSLAVALRLGKYIEENIKDVKVIYTRTTDVFVDLENRAQIANKAKADLFISIHCNAAGKPVIVTDPKTGKKRPKTYRNKKGKIVVVETSNPVPFGTETYVMGLKNEEGKMKVATRENSAIFFEEDYEKKYGGFDPESEESYIIMSNYTSAYVIQSASLAMKIQEEYTRKAGRIDKGVHRQSIWVLWRTSMPSILTELGYLTNPLEESFLGSEKGQEYLAKALFRGVRKYKDEVEGKKKEYNDEFENQPSLENENLKAGIIPGQKKSNGDDDSDSLIKKIEEKNLLVVPETTIVRQKDEKEKVNDDKYASIEIKKNEVTEPVIESSDTSVGAKEIANKFRKEKKDSAKSGNSITPDPKTIIIREQILFKVQFASSDVQLNLKQGKFSEITDADFYRLDNVLKYTSGKFKALKDAVEHKNKLREKGFKDCFVDLRTASLLQ